jgi:hypothetical protein
MTDYLENVLRLDAQGRHPEITAYLASIERLPEIPYRIFSLLTSFRYFEAYTLARLMIAHRIYNPAFSLAQAVGGLLFGDAQDAKSGVATLAALVDRLSPERQRLIGRELVHPVIAQLVYLPIVPSDILALLEIYQAGLPEMRRLFDWADDGRRPDLAEWQRQGRERAKLITFSSPPPETPRRPLKALVAMRERMLPHKLESRLFDFGPLIASAMVEYGWQARHYPMSYVNIYNDYSTIVARCQQEDIDVLFLDDHVIQNGACHGIRDAMLRQIREFKPEIKIVAIHLDPWMIDSRTMVDTSPMIDGLWAPHPTLPLWRHPALADKMLFMPFPLAGHCPPATTPLRPGLTFSGGVMGYNWHRAFWISGAVHGLSIEPVLTIHMDDGLSPLESHAVYMARLESSTCSVNFSMRSDLSRILTARAFETVMAGGLLVQEETPELDYYFVSGEHYLRFETVSDLRAIATFIAEQPEQAEEIRRRGNAYARAAYGDEKIISYVDAKLFH